MLRIYNYRASASSSPVQLRSSTVGNTPALYVPFFGSPLKWVVMLAPLAFMFFFTFEIQTMSSSTAQITFWAFCAMIGLGVPCLHRSQHRPDIFHRRHYVRCDQPLQLFHQT